MGHEGARLWDTEGARLWDVSVLALAMLTPANLLTSHACLSEQVAMNSWCSACMGSEGSTSSGVWVVT